MRFAFFFILALGSGTAICQTTIRGTVNDQDSQPLPGANVMIVNSYDGTTTSADGSFSFETSTTGEQTISVSFIGYHEYVQNISIAEKTIMLSVTLIEKVNELNAISISAGAFNASDEARRTIFKAVDIATTAGATADIAGALNTLPGTQKVGESGRLFVRGGDGNETRTFIDGMVVLDAYGPSAPNTPSRGRFLPFMFKGTSFSTGGYSAEYGQALSSALVLDSRDKTELTRTDIGIMSVGADVAHTQAWNSGSLAAKVQYTNLEPYFNLIPQNMDWRSAPESLEGVVAFRNSIGKDGILKVFGNLNNATLSLYNHPVGDEQTKIPYKLSNQYQYLNTFYKSPINEHWIIRAGTSYTSISNRTTAGADNITEREDGKHAKVAVEGSLHEQVELKAGVEVLSRDYNYHIHGLSSAGFQETITSVFTEADVYATNAFVARIGGRAEHNDLQGALSIDPRFSVAHKTGATGQVSFAYGIFRQSVKNEWLRINKDLAAEKANHFILNYQRIENNKVFRIEGYYKQYDDLLWFNEQSEATNNGKGYARGAELFWRDNETFRGLDYWISYSFLDTERKYLHFTESATPAFASTHNFSAVGKYFVQKLRSQVGVTYSFSSPRPYNNPNAEGTNKGRTPSYHDVSLNWSYLPKPWLIVYASCTNLTGHRNIFGYEYGTVADAEGNYPRRAITQPAPRFLFIGIFITLSKEKSVNQLPSL